MNDFSIPQPPSIPVSGNPFANTEQVQLAEIFGSPLVKRYIQHLIWNTIIDSATIPLPNNEQEVLAHALRSAYAKGSLSILYTLNTIEKPAAPPPTGREPT